MKTRLFGFTLLLLVGCSTSAPPARPHPVPPARRFAAELLRPSHRRSCALTISREPEAVGIGLNVYLDGEQIARLAAGESITVYVKPGWHHVSVKPLFAPPVRKVCHLLRGQPVTLRISDRNGTQIR